MTAIASNLQAVRLAIARAATQARRDVGAVSLLAVSKTFPAAAVREAYAAGQRAFGESYVQEALDKMAELQDLDIEWHFIGPLQSNKTRAVAENFAWVHGVDRLKIAERLSSQRPSGLQPLQVCIQVNVSGEGSKSGVPLHEAARLAQQVAALPGLALRGLMAIPAPTNELAAQRKPFAQLRELMQQLRASGLRLDTLSMGMSQDMEAAICEGATIVRIGSAIFGQRNYGET
ncbi:MAG TPA: YggS family pyridoxal phosphate-dependent enzyme [Gallionellaceae bacterium]|nr:YggS family pyridoxal phosphate-dependent enzyme [Gallionellaceae bacterium]